MEGGCYCGAVRFKADAEPLWVGACHCVDCRKISGAPYTIWAGYKHDSFRILKGTPEEFKSSEKAIRSFCGTCHAPSTFVYTDPAVSDEDNLVYIAIGTADDPSNYKPMQHIWVSQKLSWVEINDGLPQREI